MKRYNDGEAVVDNKPFTVIEIGAVKKYEITFQEHSDSYDFFNSEKLVDEYLLSVKSKMFCTNTNFYIRCGFSLENMQAPLTDDDVPLTNSRYWSTEPIQTKSFNDFVFFSSREWILNQLTTGWLAAYGFLKVFYILMWRQSRLAINLFDKMADFVLSEAEVEG